MIDLTPIVEAVACLAGALITAFLIPYIKSKLNTQQLEKFRSWTWIGVTAAEQFYHESGQGDMKKKYVMDFLAKKGFTVDMATLEALIESTVNTLKG